MKQKIISVLMAMVVLLTTVDLSVFASEATVSSNEVQSVIEEANDDVETTGELETENEKDKTLEETIRFEEKLVEKEEKVSSNSVVNVTSTVTESGQCGENLTWKIEGDTLTISGTGDMWNYELATGAPWYNLRMNLKNLVIEEGTTSIGDWAFHDCEFFIGDLVIPDSVVHIGKGAFSGCKGFTGNLILPEKLESIGVNAFWSCMRLTGDLIIPEGVTRIEPSTFYACYDLNGKLVLPENLTFIGSQAFSGCENLIGDLTIPSNVNVIEEYAFVGCSSLDGSLILPKKITEIGSSTFSGCSGITGSVTIPQNVTFIGDSAFKDCSGITKFIIEGDISNIANMAFSNCSSVSTIKFLGEVQWMNRAFAGVTANVYYSSKKSDWSKIINSDLGGTLTWIPYDEDAENETVSGQCGDNLTWKIEDDTFIVSGTGDMWDYGWTETPPWHQYIDGMQLKLEIQDGVNSIGSSAFMCNCKFIGSLEIPDSVTKIGDAAFYGCGEFTGNLIIPSSVSEIGESAFFACSGFTGSLEIPDGVTSIKPRAFGGCSGLTGDLEISDSVTEIGGEAFVLCGFTGNLRIPASVTTINFSAFAGCSGLTGNLKIPDSVTFIGNGAFKKCSGFTGDLNLSESVVWIGESAFAECSGLSGTAHIRGELENIGENAFTTITKIYGRAGTLVETYAKNNNIIFEELDDLPIQEIVKVEAASDLMKISDNVSKGVTDYKGQTIEITQDIDLSSETWLPIGNTSRPFRGNIQGNGCAISGIRCNDVYGGLIGCWASQESSYIDNLIVENMQLTGKRSGGIVSTLWVDENDQADISNVTIKGTINGISLISGGVVGAISGNGKVQISGCNIDVSMYSGPVYNDNYGCIGGIIGSATDSGSGELIISSCIVNGNITTEQTYSYCSSEAGGIIGLSKVKAVKIEQCSKKGKVSCKAYYAHTGGFIGSAEIRADSSLIISDSYVNADITSTCTNGNSQCGGFIGHTTGTGGNPIKITNSYITGSMNADNKAAFVCWYSEYVCPVVQNCYFDMTKLGLSKEQMVCHLETFSKDWLSDNITNSGGLSTDGMKVVDNYTNWDFENVWGMPIDFNECYPALRIENFEEKEEKEEIDYSGYRIEIYSQFSNCNIGVNQTFVLLPAMVKDGEALKGEKGWIFTIKDEQIAEIQEYTETVFGPSITIKGKNIGATELDIVHVSTGRNLSIVINVVDTIKFFNVTELEKIKEGYGIYNEGIYMENFKTSRRNKGYDVSFDAYNTLQMYGAVEVYNKEGKLVDVERINKFEKYEEGFEDIVLSLGNLIHAAFTGTILSSKSELHSKRTSIEIWVPDDGYMYISSNMSKSMGAHIYNMVDLSIWALSVGNDVEEVLSSSKNKDAIIESTSKNVMKQYIEAVKAEIVTDATKEKFQSKLYKSLTKDISKDTLAELVGELVTDSNAFLEELDIDLVKELKDVAVSYGDTVLVEAFKKLGGVAGVTLSGIFKVNEYLNKFMQIVHVVTSKDSKEIKIYIDVDNDKLVSNDVVVENAEGKPIADNTLIVKDISKDENSKYILESFQNGSKVKILDITMYCDNEEVQPNGKIRVKILLPEQFDKDRCIVYRVEADGTFTDMNAYYKEGFIIFETNHLSKYLIVEKYKSSDSNNDSDNSWEDKIEDETPEENINEDDKKEEKMSEDKPDVSNEDDTKDETLDENPDAPTEEHKEDEMSEDNKPEGGNAEGSNIEEKVEFENNNDTAFDIQLGESKSDEQDMHNEVNNSDIIKDMGETEDDISTNVEENNLGTVTMGAIIVVLCVVCIHIRNKKRN